MKHSSNSDGFASLTAKVIVVIMAVCFVFAAVPFATTDTVPVANAATVSYTTNSSDTVGTINAQLAGYEAGTIVNMVLAADIDFTDTASTYSSVVTGLVIPAGITVNLYLNSHNIKYVRESGGAWQLPGVYGIVNNGTLNVYSGSSAANPNATTISTATSCINVTNVRTGMKATTANEESYSNCEAIYNLGNLTVNKNVSIVAYSQLQYTDNASSCEASATGAATGIYNATNSATCVANAVNISASVSSQGWTSAARRGHSRAYSYGIYGGQVTVNGSTKITVNSASYCPSSSSTASDHTARGNSVAYDIASSGTIKVSGGDYSYGGTAACGAKNGAAQGALRVFMGGIITTSGNVPMLSDGTFTVPTSNSFSCSDSTYTYNECIIAKTSTLPLSGRALLTTVAGYSRSDSDYPTQAIEACQYVDECGNSYTTTQSTSDGTHPTAIIRGAAAGTYRVHVVYRYWTSQNKTAVDTSIVGSDGNAGYSYLPLADGTNVVDNSVQLSGLVSSNSLVKTAASGISYVSGATPCNSYYWSLYNLAYTSTTAWFSDYNVASSSNRGTIFRNFSTTGATNTSCAAGQQTPIYIFVDYYKIDPTGITATAGTNDVASMTYTGYNAKPGTDFSLAIKDGVNFTDFTSDYDIDFTDASRMTVNYSYTGTNAAGVALDNSSGELPKDAGNYQVTLSIPACTTYSKEPATNKNREALTYTFTLIIEQAMPSRGSLPETVTLTYGDTLAHALGLSAYSASGKPSDGTVSGQFSFTNSSDGTSYKNVGTTIVSITWTPTYSLTAQAKNYKQTTFTVTYTCTKASLVITPNAAAVTYGETVFSTPFTSAVTGLCGNDNTTAVREQIASILNYMIFVNGSYVAYSPDDINAGSYAIRATFSAFPSVLDNYEISYVYGTESNPEGMLTVGKRNIVVTATAIDRAYAPDNYNVTVTLAVTSGKYNSDDIRVLAANGALADNTVGTQTVNGITRQTAAGLLTGGAAANYNVQSVEYTTGSTLTVVISKATPTVTVPTVSDVYYKASRTLGDVELSGYTASVAGSWVWVNTDIIPTVAVSAYNAKFVPDDDENYEVLTRAISFNVLPTAVTVTYNATVSYGAAVPNITAYTYTSVNDPDFNIDNVTTTGNINPSTTYEKGSPVVAGGYPVTINAPSYRDADGNYTFTIVNGVITVVPKVITFTVNNAEITYGATFSTSPAARSVSYDSSLLVGSDTLTAITSDGSEPSFSYSTDYRYADNYGVGTYYIRAVAAFNTSANYSVVINDGTLTVTKADLVIKANSSTLAYNSEIPVLDGQFTVVGAKRNETIDDILTSGTISVDTSYFKGAPVSSTGYTVTVDITEAVFANYNVTAQNGTITVIKATPVISTYPTASITYGQSLSQAVFTGAVVDGSIPGVFSYTSGSTVPAYSNTPYTIYTAVFIPQDTANYNTVSNLYLSLTVNKMTISGNLTVTGTPMVGETLTVDVSGLDPDEAGVYSYAWYIGASQIGTGATLTLTTDHQGNVITVMATANGYYQGTVTCDTTTISPLLTSVEAILATGVYGSYFNVAGLNALYEQTQITYDAATHGVNMTLLPAKASTTAVGNFTVKYNGSTTIPTKAGYYAITVDVSTPEGVESMNIAADENGVSYDTISGKYVYAPVSNYSIGTLYIAKAVYNVTVTVSDKVYDGYTTATAASITQSGAAVLPGNVSDDVSFNSAAASYSFDNANVGTSKTVTCANAALTGSAADNYELALTLANGGKAAVTSRTLRVAVAPVNRAYEPGNTDVELTFNIDAASIAPADSSALVYINELTARGTADSYLAGTRNVSVTGVELTGSKAGNYTLELTNLSGLTVEILKATPDYPLPSAGALSYDSGRTLADISLGDSRWTWDDSVSATVPGAGSHTFKAVYTPADTANYRVVEYDVTLNIAKTAVTVTAANFTINYGDGEPTYYYTANGFTGSDTVKNAVSGYVLMNCAYEQGADIGTYPVVLTGAFESDNYSFRYVNGAVTVNKRIVYVTAIAESRPYEAGNLEVNVSFSALSNLYSGDVLGVYLYGTFPITGTVETDVAGTKYVTYTSPVLAGAKADNYTLKFTNPSLMVEISKAVIPGVVLPTSATVAYGQKLSTAEFTSSYQGTEYGTFSMYNANSTPAAVGTTSNTYKVVFTPFNTTNYAQIVDYITLTVENAALNLTLSVVGTVQTGNTLYVVTNDIPAEATEYLTFDWYTVTNPTDDPVHQGYRIASDTSSYNLTESEEGAYVVVVARTIDGSPYTCSASVVTESKVQEETLTFWQRIWNWFYRVIASLTQIFGKIGG